MLKGASAPGQMGDRRPDWRRRQSEMGIRYNPMRVGEARPIPGEIVSRQTRKPNKKKEGELAGGGGIHLDPDEVFAFDPEDRFSWLQSALLLAGRGNIKADTLYEIVVCPKFAGAVVGNAVGDQMKASLLANLHLFKKEQQKVIKSNVCSLLVSPSAIEDQKVVGASSDAEGHTTKSRDAKAQSGGESGRKSNSRSPGRRKGSRKARSRESSSSRNRRRSRSRSHSTSQSTKSRKSGRRNSRKAKEKRSCEQSPKKGRKRKRSGTSSPADRSSPVQASSSRETPTSREEASLRKATEAPAPQAAEAEEMKKDAIAGAYQEMNQIAQEEAAEAQRLQDLERQALARKQKEEELRHTLMKLAAGEEEAELNQEKNKVLSTPAELGENGTKEKKKKKEKKERKAKKGDR